MVACNRCNSSNSLDSKFCRQCGASLPEEDLEKAVAELDALIAEGFHAFNEGRTEEAALIAASAVESNPSSGSAVSLKGMCHERNGEMPEALECYEKVVALNPDSALDKIKVTQLRNQFAGRGAELKPPSRPRALVGAFSAVVLVVALGSIAAVLTGGQPQEAVASNDQGPGQLQGFPVGPPGAATQAAPADGTTTPGAVTPGVVTPTPVPSIVNPGTAPGMLPSVNNGGFGEFPVTPPGPIGVQPSQNTDVDRGTTRGGPRIDPLGPPIEPGGGDPRPAQIPKEDTGQIDIRISGPGPKTGAGGSTSTSSSNGIEALSRTARQQYQLGKFADAARSYEQVLRGGGDSGSTNQRLGQCYEKLGRKADAQTAYTRAIASLDGQVKAGKSEAQFALDACKQALKILQGS